MKKISRNLLSAEEFVLYHKEICKENRLALRLLAVTGLPLSIANVFAQLIISGSSPLDFRNYGLLIYFFILFLVERFLLPQQYQYSTAIIYFAEAPVMILSILLGTIWDPGHQATTILIFLLAMPVFILDRPIRLMSITGGWALLFLALCYQVKLPALCTTDTIHIAEFYFTSIALTYIVQRVRLDSLRNLERTRYHLEHDELTDTRNKRSLSVNTDQYLEKPLFILLADLDQLDLYNDFYGHETGDDILIFFTHLLKETFGSENTYRYGGDEILCVAPFETAGEYKIQLASIRSSLEDNHFGDYNLTLTCAFGYVTGTPHSAKEFQEMIQLADIYTHRAKRKGKNQTVGSPYDSEHLRAGIVESNLTTHAKEYELNQLTGLPMISYFFLRSDELLSNIVIMSRRPVVGFFNILKCKAYNDEFGYEQGDALIRFAAEQLLYHFQNRQVCYISGGQFGILCYLDEVDEAMREINSQFLHFHPGYPIHCIAGFAEYTGDEKAISLMDRARQAHDSIYGHPEAIYRLYDAKLDESLRFNQYLINHLDDAIENDYLKVYYQPIMRSATGKVCNEEALSRWIDPQYGFLSPAQFIPVLEENRLLYKLNLHVVQQVLKDLSLKKSLGMPVVPISVNLSRYDFDQCDMVEKICELTDASGFSREMIKIEITESAFVKDQELLKREVSRFRENGFEVWMDDFGSEYSTLNLLQEMDFDLITHTSHI